MKMLTSRQLGDKDRKGSGAQGPVLPPRHLRDIYPNHSYLLDNDTVRSLSSQGKVLPVHIVLPFAGIFFSTFLEKNRIMFENQVQCLVLHLIVSDFSGRK